MQTVSASTPLANNPYSILLMGAPGTAKTTLATQFPNVAVLDCDENLNGPTLYNQKINKDHAFAYDRIRIDANSKVRPADILFDTLMTKLTELKAQPQYQTIVIDSLTAVNELIQRKILSQQKRDTMEMRDWNTFKAHFYNLIFTKLRELNRNTICIVHEQKITETPAGSMSPVVKEYEPSIQGRIGDFFGAFFTDVLRTDARSIPGGKQVYLVKSGKSPLTPLLKNSVGMPFEIEIADGKNGFELINKYYKIPLS